MFALAATMEHASVEFTSPATTTITGWCSATTRSNAIMIFAVCSACEPDPTARWMSGARRPRSRKIASLRCSS
jgi:hypothetical protein